MGPGWVLGALPRLSEPQKEYKHEICESQRIGCGCDLIRYKFGPGELRKALCSSGLSTAMAMITGCTRRLTAKVKSVKACHVSGLFEGCNLSFRPFKALPSGLCASRCLSPLGPMMLQQRQLHQSTPRFNTAPWQHRHASA